MSPPATEKPASAKAAKAPEAKAALPKAEPAKAPAKPAAKTDSAKEPAKLASSGTASKEAKPTTSNTPAKADSAKAKPEPAKSDAAKAQAKPEAAKADASKAKPAAKPDAAKTKPDAAKPDAAKPDAAKAKPEAAKADVKAKPDTAKADASKVDTGAVAAALAAAEKAAPEAVAEAVEPEPIPDIPIFEEEEPDADPEAAFERAREVVEQVHSVLTQLKEIKDAGDDQAEFSDVARELQLQLLAMRRAHRGMAKAVDAGRVAEAQARKMVDTEHSRLETRRYDSACNRIAARRCRTFPTPQLAKLKPHLEGIAKLEDEEEAQAISDPPKTAFADCLEAESKERARLAVELEALEKEKAKHLDALREREKVASELLSRLATAQKSLEPVCNLLPTRKRKDDAIPKEVREKLSAPLQLVASKFDTLAQFGADSFITVTVDVGESDPPPAKKPRTEASMDVGSVTVVIAGVKGNASLRFQSVQSQVVTVSNSGALGDALLQGLFPDDDGQRESLRALAAGTAGRPYVWAQVLCGLREALLSKETAVESAAVISALEVASHVRDKLV